MKGHSRFEKTVWSLVAQGGRGVGSERLHIEVSAEVNHRASSG